eukprot:3404075-Amphidinium_carterae.2
MERLKSAVCGGHAIETMEQIQFKMSLSWLCLHAFQGNLDIVAPQPQLSAKVQSVLLSSAEVSCVSAANFHGSVHWVCTWEHPQTLWHCCPEVVVI